MIEKLLEENDLTHEELIAHWEAYQYLSNTGSMVKLKKVKDEARNKIAKFYRAIRQKGYCPIRPDGGKMKFGKRDSGYIPYTPQVEKDTRTECKFGECQSCEVIIYPERSNCETRTKEWMKGISRILSVSKRDPGEGKRMAQEFIDYMSHDFMGGIYPPSKPGPSLTKNELQQDIPF